MRLLLCNTISFHETILIMELLMPIPVILVAHKDLAMCGSNTNISYSYADN
jgi:hypothetical protein